MLRLISAIGSCRGIRLLGRVGSSVKILSDQDHIDACGVLRGIPKSHLADKEANRKIPPKHYMAS